MKTELVGAILEVKDPIDSLRFYQSHLKLPVDEFDQKVYLTDNVALQFHKNQEIIKMGEVTFVKMHLILISLVLNFSAGCLRCLSTVWQFLSCDVHDRGPSSSQSSSAFRTLPLWCKYGS
jgi:hypothetical protein